VVAGALRFSPATRFPRVRATVFCPWRSATALPTVAIQRHPRDKRVHVVPPVDDLLVLDRDDGDEPVVVGHARRDDPAVHLVLQDYDARILRAVNDEPAGGVEPDVVSVARELVHQARSAPNDPGPTREVVEELEEGVLVSKKCLP
jgi:hypothetical protein